MSDQYQIDPREYGQLEQQVAQLTVDVHQLRKTVDEINTLLQQTKGGWKALVVLAGFCGTISGGVAWFLTNIKLPS